MSAKAYRPELGKCGVMAACIDLLTVHRVWHRRFNTGAIKLEDKNGKSRLFRAGSPGMADILATPRSLHIPSSGEFSTTGRTLWLEGAPAMLWIECKATDGKQRPEQKDFQAEVEAAGHEYLLVNDVQVLIDWMKKRGIIR